MIGAWIINVDGRTYGPYSSERMLAFTAERRLGPHSLIARDGSDDWHEAREEPEFSDLFAAKEYLAGDTPRTQKPAETVPAQPIAAEPAGGEDARPMFGAGQAAEDSEPKKAQFAIIIDLKSRAPGKLDEAIMSLGPAYKLLPNVWIVTTAQSVNAVRNRLVQELGKLDTLFVVDATRGKAAWFNFGPEADVRIRKVWQKAG
jgi:hypothetical protein